MNNTNKTLLLAGGNGFIGRHLARHFLDRGWRVIVLTREPGRAAPGVIELRWDGRTQGAWAHALDEVDVLVNLTGKNVDCRYTPEARREILESRTHSVAALAEALKQARPRERLWVQAATLAIYGDAGEAELDETAQPAEGFSPEVAKAWEAALDAVKIDRLRKVTLRISFVLGADGGALPKLATLTRAFLGGAVGNGRQFYSWLHVDDLAGILHWLINDRRREGLYHATAPEPVRNADFMAALRKRLHRPWAPTTPAWAVRLGCRLLRTEPELALRGRRGLPKRLQTEGYQFRFPTLGEALADLYPATEKHHEPQALHAR